MFVFLLFFFALPLQAYDRIVLIGDHAYVVPIYMRVETASRSLATLEEFLDVGRRSIGIDELQSKLEKSYPRFSNSTIASILIRVENAASQHHAAYCCTHSDLALGHNFQKIIQHLCPQPNLSPQPCSQSPFRDRSPTPTRAIEIVNRVFSGIEIVSSSDEDENFEDPQEDPDAIYN